MIGDGSTPYPGLTMVASKQQLHGLRLRAGCHTKPYSEFQANTISLLCRGPHRLLSQGDATLKHSLSLLTL